jgi:DNA processing protein
VPCSDDHLAAWTDWLTLDAIPHVGRRRLWALVSALGSPRNALEAKPDALREVEGIDEGVIKSLLDHRDALDLRDAAAKLGEMGARLISFLDDDYPSPLRRMDDPPPFLMVLGELTPMDQVAVAVVGSRNATDYGKRMAETIAGGLAEAGVTIISGFATGIDGAAHRVALDAGGRTIAVLGCGLDVVYPATHRALRERVRESGALLTTHAPGTQPRGEHFPDRNAILAGLAQGVLIVEASEKSGTLITAEHALAQGQRLYAVPGDVTRANSRGVNRLIQEGSAHLVTSAEDLLTDLGSTLRTLMVELGLSGDLGGNAEATLPVLDELTPAERHLFHRIQAGPIQADALARGLAAAERAALPMQLVNLQLSGLIEELPGKRYVACPAAAGLPAHHPMETELPS